MKKMLAMILAALMLSAMAVVPAYADTTAAVPAGTDFFLDKNPSLEDGTDGAGGWEKGSMAKSIAKHDKTDVNYSEELGEQYLAFHSAAQGTTLPFFDDLEGGRHYYLSFYVRGAEKITVASTKEPEKTVKAYEGMLDIRYRINKSDYHKATLDYKWAQRTPLVGIDSANAEDADKWTKLTYDIIIPPNANGLKVVICMNTAKIRLSDGSNESVLVGDGFDVDGFSLTAEEYFSDNMLRNGNFDAIRGDLDPIEWDADKVQTGSQMIDDGNGGYYLSIFKQGAMVQNGVWLVGGKRYKATFKFKCQNNIRGCGIGIDGKYYFSFSDDCGVRCTRDNEWEQFTVYFTVPGTAGEYKAHTFSAGYASSGVYGNSSVGIDDVVLTEVEDTAVSYVKDIPGEYYYKKGYDIYFRNPYVDTANGLLWWRGTEEDAITDYSAVNGVHPVTVNAYHFPKAAGEKASLISAVYKENAGTKQLVSVKVTEVTAADTNPVALTHTIDVKEADASSAWVESFVWTNITKLAPIANSVYTLGK